MATLKLFAGELDAASVLRHPELRNNEGTGILAMAYECLEAGPDAEAQAEITRLLDLLVFSTEQLGGMAGLGPTPTAPADELTPRAPRGAADDCRKFFTGFLVPAGIDQCLQLRSPPLLEKLCPGADRVFGPVASSPSAGRAEHHCASSGAWKR